MAQEDINAVIARLNGVQESPDASVARLNGQQSPPTTGLMESAAQIALNAPTSIPGATASIATSKPATDALLNTAQGITQGATTLAIGAINSLRNYTDALGFTNPEKTQASRAQLQNMQQSFDQSAAGQSTAGQVGQAAAQYGAPIAIASAIGGAGVPANAIGGAIQAGLTDAGDATGQSLNIIGGGLLGAGTGLFFKGLGKLALNVDPAKAAAYREAGIKPMAGQLTSDKVQASSLGKLQRTLATLPWKLGTKGTVLDQTDQIQEFLPKVVKQLEEGAMPSKPLYQASVDAPEIMNKTFAIKSVADSAKRALDKLGPLKEIEDVVKSKLAEIAKNTPQNMAQLQDLRMTIGKALDQYTEGGLTNQVARTQLKGLYRTLSGSLQKVANTNGVGDKWALADKAMQTEKIVDMIQSAQTKSNALHDPLLSSQYNIKQFTKEVGDKLRALDDKGIEIPKFVTKAINNFKIITADLVGPDAAKVSRGTLSWNDMMNNVAKIAVGYGGVTHPEVGGPAAATLLGLKLLVSTGPGINLLAAASKNNHAALRMAITSAAALGAAKIHQMADPPAQASALPMDEQSVIQRLNGVQQ